MKITVIIPSYNQVQYLDACLQSLWGQHDENLEVLVFDAGSEDGSVEVLKKHGASIAYWESVPDRGQSHAINKGLARMSGDVWTYLNSDDLLAPGALASVRKVFVDPSVKWLSGKTQNFSSEQTFPVRGSVLPERPRDYLPYWGSLRGKKSFYACSCSTFMRREVYESIGAMDESLHYTMDSEYYARAGVSGGFSQHLCPDVLGLWRLHDESKTCLDGIAYRFIEEELAWSKSYSDLLEDAERSEFLSQWRHEASYLPLRKTAFFYDQGDRVEALKCWVGALGVYPRNAFRRWWISLGLKLMKP